MSGSMVHHKSTRWDCDVKLRGGIPDSIPSFYGWDHLDSSRDNRFIVCHHCNSYIPQNEVPGHHCWDQVYVDDTIKTIEDVAVDDVDGFDNDWDEQAREGSVSEEEESYVVATEETEGDGKCFLCMERLVLVFNVEEEEWVYPGCLSIQGNTVHVGCHEVISRQEED